MNKKSVLVTVVMVFVFSSVVYGQPWDGNGVDGDPYQIWDANDMQAIGADANYWDAHFKLMADIDLGSYTGTSFNIIGASPYYPVYGTPFSGVFDGNGHTISNFTYTSTSERSVGIFGYIDDPNAEVKNLGLIVPNISSGTAPEYYSVGSLAGILGSGTIEACYVEGGIVEGEGYGDDVGGLVGRNNTPGNILNCHSSASVAGNDDFAGGLAGSSGGVISGCYTTGNVTGKDRVGGLVGFMYAGSISDSYSSSNVTGYERIGGLVGHLDYSSISGCYTTGSVEATGSSAGGLVGYNWGGHILDCHSTSNVTGGEYCVGGLVGYNYYGVSISNSYSEGIVVGKDWVGGLVGANIDGDISGSYSSSSVTASDECVGGLVGGHQYGSILNCYSEGSAAGEDKVGGLVGRNAYEGTVSNCYSLCIVDGNDSVGGLIGLNEADSNVMNCYSAGGVTGDSNVGGLVGNNWDGGSISNSYSSSSVTGDSNVGGLVGNNWDGGSISECYSEGLVTGSNCIGGLAGSNGNNSSIANCYSQSSVDGNDSVGGLVGLNEGNSNVMNCYSTGGVTGAVNVGGLLGYNSVDSDEVVYCYWDVNSSGQVSSAGGEGKTTEQMKRLVTFAGWVCTGTWTIDELMDYPRLLWEGRPGVVLEAELYFGGGSGDANDPYLVGTSEQLNSIGLIECIWDRHFRLMDDIDMSGYTGASYNIIGELYYDSGWVAKPFRGVFDGGGHTISNFTYSSTGEESIGLFGYIDDPNAEIKNLGLVEPDVNAGTRVRVGALVGGLSEGTVRDCYVEGGSVAGGADVGGLIGGGSGESASVSDCYFEGTVTGRSGVGGLMGSFRGIISSCYSAGSVTGEDYSAGGLVGYNRSSISNCYSTCSVTGSEHEAGGLVGWNDGGSIQESYSTGDVTGVGGVGGLVGNNDRGIISRSYSTGDVAGENSVGGLVGHSRGSDINSISECYSMGSASGNDYVGGLVGTSGWDEIVNCYSAGSVTGIGDHVGGLVGRGSAKNSYWDVNSSGLDVSDGGVGLTTEQMQSKGTYLFWGCGQETWTIDDGNDYPRLAWEGKPGEVIEGFGCGTAEEPYLVYEAVHMQIIGGSEWSWDKHYKLMADIDLGAYAGTSFNIIGHYPNLFTGVFDGNGHTISNFTYDCNGVGDIGLFGYIDDPNAEIKGLGLIEPDVNAGTISSRVGALVGYLREGAVSDCYVEGGSVTGDRYVGGLVGDGSDCNVLKCYSTGSVTGGDRGIGGLVGSGGNISNSYSSSSVTGNEDVGGLVGGSRFNISNSYSSGSVTGGDHVGGLVGYSWSVVFNCYSSGSVAGDSNVGGLIGYDYNLYGDYTASFWDSDVNPDVNGIGNRYEPNVMGLPTVEMQTESTFTDAGWDFVTPIWTIDDGNDYPRLWWENVGSVVACIVGGDRSVEAGEDCEARVVLDGSCSSDADSTEGTNDDINDFEWYVVDSCDPNYEDYLGSGEVIECNLPLGENIIVLEVTDKAGAFDSNEVTIMVEDVTPPEFSLAVEPNELWPPNHKMVLITVEWEVSDNCDDEPEVRLVSITSSEDDDGKGDGATSDDIVIGEDGSIYLRAESVGYLDGRVYTITYEAVDDSGNATIGSAEVVVPDGYRWRHLEHKGEREGAEE